MAQQHISPKVNVRAFKKCCTSNAMDGTDNDVLQNDSQVDGNVSSKFEEDKVLSVKMDTTNSEDGESVTDW